MGLNLDSLEQDAIKKLGDTVGKEEGLKDVGKKVKGILGN